MELEQARKRAEELRVIIERNNRLYYDQDARSWRTLNMTL